jgi:hypothetical protein
LITFGTPMIISKTHHLYWFFITVLKVLIIKLKSSSVEAKGREKIKTLLKPLLVSPFFPIINPFVLHSPMIFPTIANGMGLSDNRFITGLI